MSYEAAESYYRVRGERYKDGEDDCAGWYEVDIVDAAGNCQAIHHEVVDLGEDPQTVAAEWCDAAGIVISVEDWG